MQQDWRNIDLPSVATVETLQMLRESYSGFEQLLAENREMGYDLGQRVFSTDPLELGQLTPEETRVVMYGFCLAYFAQGINECSTLIEERSERGHR